MTVYEIISIIIKENGGSAIVQKIINDPRFRSTLGMGLEPEEALHQIFEIGFIFIPRESYDPYGAWSRGRYFLDDGLVYLCDKNKNTEVLLNIIAESDTPLSIWDAEEALNNSYGLRGAREVILDALAKGLIRINTTTLELSISG